MFNNEEFNIKKTYQYYSNIQIKQKILIVDDEPYNIIALNIIIEEAFRKMIIEHYQDIFNPEDIDIE